MSSTGISSGSLLTAATFTQTVVAAVLLSSVSLLYRSFRKWFDGPQTIGGIPGLKVMFQPLAPPGAMLPTTRWNPGMRFTWESRKTLYDQWNSEVVSVVPFLAGNPSVYTSSLEVAKQVVAAGAKSVWVKPVSASRAMLFWGMNLIASEKDTWRRHRRIMGPAFSNETYAFVWSETARIYHDMISSERWDSPSSIEIGEVQKYTFKLALSVITSCGFGVKFRWDEPPMDDSGKMSVQEALKLHTDSFFVTVAAPKWFYKLPIKWIRALDDAHNVLRSYMHKQVVERKAALASGDQRKDVFSLLVSANEDEDGKLTLNDDELIGNVFGLLFAGHETTAHTLAATLGFLSIYPEVQQQVYEEIMTICPKGDPSFEDFNKFEKVLSAFYEALRLYPAGYVMIREATEDTILDVPIPGSQNQETKSVPMQKGAQVIVDMVGVQYNPRYYPEPNKYKPERWTGLTNDIEAMTAFSVGPRACIGRRFASIEAVCFLVLFLRDFKVEPGEMKPQEKGHPEEWRERVMDASVMLTLGIKPVPVKLVRRV